MSDPAFPKSWKKESKPHKFCPGCGQSLALKLLGEVIDNLKIQEKTVYGCDIGCSLLSWNMFDVDTIQTHHGRVTPVMVGLKIANPDAVSIALMGDGGGYAIGAQHLINAAMRNDHITAILINNANYAMTGGQMAPTTLVSQKTATTPNGRNPLFFGNPIHGPEMLQRIVNQNAYLARTSSLNIHDCREKITKAINNQIDGRGFSFLEILAPCPVNWHMQESEAINFCQQEMTKEFPLGEFKCLQE